MGDTVDTEPIIRPRLRVKIAPALATPDRANHPHPRLESRVTSIFRLENAPAKATANETV